MWDGIDKRKFPRAEYPCSITVKRKDCQDKISALTENIGVGGICVIITKDLGIFSPVEIELDLLDGSSLIECDGTIVWIVGKKQNKDMRFDTGIEFTNLKKIDADRINGIVKRIIKGS